MYGFRRDGQKLIFELNDEIILIEPWGADSLRIRASCTSTIQYDLPSALLPAKPSEPQIDISEDRGTILNGAILGEINIEEDFSGPRAELHFYNSQTGEEVLAETASHFPKYPSRYYKHYGCDRAPYKKFYH